MSRMINFVSFFRILQGFKSTKCKVNSVQDASAKCFAVHIIKFEILQTKMKKQNKKHQNYNSINEKLKNKGLMFYFSHVICKISNFNL